MAESIIFIVNILGAGLRTGTPLLFATIGELITEKAGVLNLGVEGMMLVGALAGFAVSFITGNPWLGRWRWDAGGGYIEPAAWTGGNHAARGSGG